MISQLIKLNMKYISANCKTAWVLIKTEDVKMNDEQDRALGGRLFSVFEHTKPSFTRQV